MGMTYKEVEAKEKKARKGVMKDLLGKHGLKEEDVKTLKNDSEHAISILTEDGIERIVLWKRIDESPKFKVTVDYDFTFEENPKEPNRKTRRAKKVTKK